MGIKPNKRLFWYLKDNANLDLNDPAILDMYIQQVLSCGKTNDVKELLKLINPSKFRESFLRLKRFLPNEVKIFWEDFIGNSKSITKRAFR
ncbi:hypothetical protein HZC34_00815 [Candidatus Saganbacteria bacterium]|nr:hypothetical protein [Candidatus Saganbacteria bacterium]